MFRHSPTGMFNVVATTKLCGQSETSVANSKARGAAEWTFSCTCGYGKHIKGHLGLHDLPKHIKMQTKLRVLYKPTCGRLNDHCSALYAANNLTYSVALRITSKEFVKHQDVNSKLSVCITIALFTLYFEKYCEPFCIL
ncbi:hypothetical protein EG68_01506 [Paragonimus skrjabini miyazakii]|uniref:Uncharacterized protein n=1 Tax=Paragonimus skrjabini miyazakii TaxID=59628 RepID=A0A8S9Z128_9TREM|nr:hypothetical protein EG68_01506 [Paragonimus skrjabini miyazakii]